MVFLGTPPTPTYLVPWRRARLVLPPLKPRRCVQVSQQRPRHSRGAFLPLVTKAGPALQSPCALLQSLLLASGVLSAQPWLQAQSETPESQLRRRAVGDYFTHDFHQLSLPPGTTVEGAGGPGSAEGWERASGRPSSLLLSLVTNPRCWSQGLSSRDHLSSPFLISVVKRQS